MFKKIKIYLLLTIKQKPLASFLLALILLVSLLFTSKNFIPEESPIKNSSSLSKKQVEIFNVNENFFYTINATNDETQEIDIYPQVSGVISNFYKKEGDQVKANDPLFKISNNYSGANSAEIQLSIAKNSKDLFEKNYENQIKIIELQKELAEKTDNQSDTLREISKDTLGRSKEILSLSESLLTDIQKSKDTLINYNTNGQNDAQIAQIKQSEISLLSSISALKSSIDQSEFSTSDKNSPAQISNITKELTIKQLDVQKNTLENTKKINELNLLLAQINLNNFVPSSPCNGILNQINVNKFDIVNPNTKLGTVICSDNNKLKASANIPAEIAKKINLSIPTTAEYNEGEETKAKILYISKYTINEYQNKIKFLIDKPETISLP
ncbi:MAG: HlyD family secretion protein, partial [Patescibacteria group bacterium]|nr:HlyD family secretion protein [Patescibacteria group bacterium]